MTRGDSDLATGFRTSPTKLLSPGSLYQAASAKLPSASKMYGQLLTWPTDQPRHATNTSSIRSNPVRPQVKWSLCIVYACENAGRSDIGCQYSGRVQVVLCTRWQVSRNPNRRIWRFGRRWDWGLGACGVGQGKKDPHEMNSWGSAADGGQCEPYRHKVRLVPAIWWGGHAIARFFGERERSKGKADRLLIQER